MLSNQTQKKVYISRNQFTGESGQCVCQIIAKPPIIPNILQNFKKIYSVQSRNVIQYLEFVESENNYYIFMEQLNQGTLDDIMNTSNINEDKAKCYFREILNGLKSLHENKITFVDLSPKNIFKSNDSIKIGQINICSDQLANMQTEEDFKKFGIVKEIIPPEILQNQTIFSMASDLYTASVLYFKMIFKRFPFNGETKTELIEKIKQNNIDFTCQDQAVSMETIDFLKLTLKYEPSQRLNWSQVYSHPLLKLLNIANDYIVQSTLLSISINKLITRSDLVTKTFDCEKNRQFYQEIEQNNQAVNNNIEEPAQKSDNALNEESEQFSKQLSIVKDLFKSQRTNLLKKQVDYYIEQRNMYSSLSATLSYVRLFDQEFQSFTLQFVILKIIYLISQSLIQQIDEIKNATKFEQCFNQNLQEQYDNFQKKIDEEHKIIDSQFSQMLRLSQTNLERARMKGNVDQKISDIINKTSQYTLFELLRDQTKLFIAKVPTFNIIQNDLKTQQEIIIQVLFSLALIVSYLLKLSPTQILQKSPVDYLEYIRQEPIETILTECKQKQQSIDQLFEKISKGQIRQF
ncbi:unnamed protein product (macronuclear) [Paramecium tetraurelia]|uniref:Protein kinase domain-containing protein n=1 Tax=Paramecium tetraurelia TaxID=5888 RepID=A0BSS9_PARTE|nr:uncharacterized protein GSPATT00031828001 [Paramecium tetraurelia]CAK61596.1 unnamed protein product [Paramecium tetraurelia]|eukprot:XP_001428994.1 hypothetical protein (macronuclear) [Paramecium tetraurelia strain d4-2]